MWWYISADIPVYIVSGSVVVMNTAYVCHSITYCCAFNVVTSAPSLLHSAKFFHYGLLTINNNTG